MELHCHGHWNVNAGGRFWEVHPNPIGKSQLPSNVSIDDEHWCNRWHPNGEFVNCQGFWVPPTHHAHPNCLKNCPPPTVAFDLNGTVASAPPLIPLNHRTTGTTPVQHPPSASINSNMNPSVGIPNLVNHSYTASAEQWHKCQHSSN
jgi:hypothetical protein